MEGNNEAKYFFDEQIAGFLLGQPADSQAAQDLKVSFKKKIRELLYMLVDVYAKKLSLNSDKVRGDLDRLDELGNFEDFSDEELEALNFSEDTRTLVANDEFLKEFDNSYEAYVEKVYEYFLPRLTEEMTSTINNYVEQKNEEERQVYASYIEEMKKIDKELEALQKSLEQSQKNTSNNKATKP